MAIQTATGKTFLGYFSIIPSAKKCVFYAIFHLAFLSLYGQHISSLNRLVLTDEEDAEHCSFECLIATHDAFRLSKVMLYTFHAIWQPFKLDIYHLLPKKRHQRAYLLNLLKLGNHEVSNFFILMQMCAF
jgi:hypothetical protein